MANSYFQFKQFSIQQNRCAMKVTTDGCLFGAWAAASQESGKSQESIVFSPESGRDGLQAGGESKMPTGARLLDIGCGTGLLSLMIAQKNPGLQIDAIEIDEAAAQQAKENVAVSPWKERVSVIHSDIKNYYPANKGKYDYVVCNPPFYENDLASPDEKRNKAHHNGSLLLEETVQAIRHSLTPGGKFFLLLPYKRMSDIHSLLQNEGLITTDVVLVKQTAYHSFFRVMIAGTLQKETASVNSTELIIKNAEGNYTPEFIALLKDYYLYL